MTENEKIGIHRIPASEWIPRHSPTGQTPKLTENEFFDREQPTETLEQQALYNALFPLLEDPRFALSQAVFSLVTHGIGLSVMAGELTPMQQARLLNVSAQAAGEFFKRRDDNIVDS